MLLTIVCWIIANKEVDYFAQNVLFKKANIQNICMLGLGIDLSINRLKDRRSTN